MALNSLKGQWHDQIFVFNPWKRWSISCLSHGNNIYYCNKFTKAPVHIEPHALLTKEEERATVDIHSADIFVASHHHSNQQMEVNKQAIRQQQSDIHVVDELQTNQTLLHYVV